MSSKINAAIMDEVNKLLETDEKTLQYITDSVMAFILEWEGISLEAKTTEYYDVAVGLAILTSKYNIMRADFDEKYKGINASIVAMKSKLDALKAKQGGNVA